MRELSTRRAGPAGGHQLIRQTLAEEFELSLAILLVKPKCAELSGRRFNARMSHQVEIVFSTHWQSGVRLSTFGIDNSEQIETAELSNSEAIATSIRGQLAAKLGVDAGSIDINSSITRYGVDSLIAIELAHSIETHLGVLLPMSEFISSQSITQIAVRCFELIKATRFAPAAGDAAFAFAKKLRQPTCSRCLTDNRLSGSSNNSHQKAWLITSLRRSG